MKKTKTFETVVDKYTLLGEIGKGGSGIVFEVQNSQGDSYALKQLDPHKVSSDKVRRFRNELFFCERNEYKNIIRVLDQGYIVKNDTKCPFYVMPLYNMTLRKLIESGIAHDKVLPLFSQVLDGVEAAHLQNVWHRDLKPENILYDDVADIVVIADFGIAHFEAEFLQTAVMTKPNQRLANFQYAAPEQHLKGGKVDWRADIYTLGMILNEMFTKELPIGTGYRTIEKINSDYQYLDGLVELMLRQSPDERPDSISSIKQRLIALGQQFVSQQKLSKLQNKIIPKHEMDDPLVIHPPEIVEADYNAGALYLKLDKVVNEDWINCFRTPLGGISYKMGQSPKNYSFSGDTVCIGVGEQDVQGAVDQFKKYMGWANERYKAHVERTLAKQKHEEETRLRQEQRSEEQRLRVLKELKI